MAESSYLRYPHLARDLITFTAKDDVWLASLSEAADGRGTRAWRLTADQAPVRHPRLNPSATHVAWTSTRGGSWSLGHGGAREAYAVPAEGGPVRRLIYWGDRLATVRGWVSDNEVLALSRTGQHSSMKTWAFAVPLNGPPRRLDHGPAGDVAVRDGAVLVGSAMNFEPAEPAQWKGYRGGAGGKIWYSPDGSHYTRILAEVGSNLVNPMFLPGESSVIGARSPLAAPGVAAAPGDLIVAVDGRPVDPGLGPNALLAGKADKPVELTLRRDGADRRLSWFRWPASTRPAITIWSSGSGPRSARPPAGGSAT